jgi:DNA-binding NarL/FixJ family response regulator
MTRSEHTEPSGEQGPLRILIAERHASVREAVKMFVQRQQGLYVAGEAADDRELLRLSEITRPDIILLGWDLGERPAGDLVEALRQIESQPSVIVLDVQPESARAALAAGADAFVSKGDPPQSLLAAIHSAGLQRKGTHRSDPRDR